MDSTPSLCTTIANGVTIFIEAKILDLLAIDKSSVLCVQIFRNLFCPEKYFTGYIRLNYSCLEGMGNVQIIQNKYIFEMYCFSRNPLILLFNFLGEVLYYQR